MPLFAGSVALEGGALGLAEAGDVACGPACWFATGVLVGGYVYASRGKNFIKPSPGAGPHTGFRRTPPKKGKIDNYIEFDANGRMVKRFRGSGKTHAGVQPPLVINPDGSARPASPDEIPNRNP